MVDQSSGQVRRVMELAWEEADRLGHRYLGPEHLLLGLLREDEIGAAGLLHARGVDLAAARAAMGRLAARGVVPRPRPSDAELLGSLGIDLAAIRRDTARTFGGRRWGGAGAADAAARPAGPGHDGATVGR
jgi:ATP-dependent Clp protease ATP-binding subunit ClpA